MRVTTGSEMDRVDVATDSVDRQVNGVGNVQLSSHRQRINQRKLEFFNGHAGESEHTTPNVTVESPPTTERVSPTKPNVSIVFPSTSTSTYDVVKLDRVNDPSLTSEISVSADSAPIVPSPTPSPTAMMAPGSQLSVPAGEQFFHVKVVLIVTQPSIREDRSASSPRRVGSACDFRFQELVIGTIRVKLQIWEIAYEETHFSVLSFYLPGTQCAIILYDVSDRDSFERAEAWIEEVRRRCPSAAILLAGSVSDPINNVREVTSEEATAVVERVPEVLVAVEVDGDGEDELDELLRRAAVKVVEVQLLQQHLAHKKNEEKVANTKSKKNKQAKVKKPIKQKNPCSVM